MNLIPPVSFAIADVIEGAKRRARSACRERLVDEAHDGLRGIELLRAEPRGEVRLTCSHHFGSKRILPALITFRRRYPAVRLHVALSDTNMDIVQQGIELAVRSGPLKDSLLHARKLVNEPTMVCAAPSYLRRHRAPMSIADLEHHRWVVYPPNQRSVTVHAEGKDVEVRVQGDVVTDSAAARLAFVLAGEGIARLPDYDAAAPIAVGDLVRVLPEVETAALDIFLVHGKRIGPSARLLRDFLLDTARQAGW